MAFSGLFLYHALRSSAVAVCERSAFGPSGVQFQANVLPSGNGRSISRGSVRRDPNTARTGRWRCERSGRRANRAEKAGSGGAVEGECRRREAERCAQVRSFCRKAPRFSYFHGDFCDKVRTFFLSVALFRAINRGEAPINGDENEAESARMYIRGVKNWWFHPFLVNLPQRSPRHIRISRLCAGDFNLPHERKTPHPRGAAEWRSASPPSLDPRVVLRGGLRAVVALRHAHLR